MRKGAAVFPEQGESPKELLTNRANDKYIAMVNDLIVRVRELVNEGEFSFDDGKSLVNKLKSIQYKLNIDEIDEALSRLDTLMTYLDQLERDGIISEEIYNELIE